MFRQFGRPLRVRIPFNKIAKQKSTQEGAFLISRRRTRKKVVATANRRECVYKRAGAPSVPFCEKGGTVKRVTDFLQKKSEQAQLVPTWRA